MFWLQTSTSYRSCRIFKQKVWSNSFQQKKIYQKSHDEAWFQKNIWFFWILIKFSTTCIKIVVYILSIFSIFLALNSYLHFFAFMCVYFSLYCLISNQLKIHFFSKHWVLKMHLTMADFLSDKFRNIKILMTICTLAFLCIKNSRCATLRNHKLPWMIYQYSSPQKCVLTIFINTIFAFTLPPSIDHKFNLWPFRTFQYIISIDSQFFQWYIVALL